MIKGIPARAVRASLLVAAMIAGPASLAEAAPRLTAAQKEQAQFLCQRTEFSRSEVRHLQRSPDFPVLLAYALQVCPAVAATLSDGATASVALPRVSRDNDNDRSPGRGSEDEGGEKGI
ncbi:MAG: hypothetical protein H6897_02120 [Rhodobacteraceae bacterium]|jgi:hypothetical protein|uniref:hypothetical protein n=1 Tax=Albidovulum sp. TaxID=1872424 RepID=UPI001D4C0CE5|nr:hypothetical protein [uncultured Defluviimonas sp.]MCB2126480.1 hypothetical protein [Paracoccaceae bacterium]MCC0068707.1 hypothetical protein [Paracoccaceae bacterium]